MITNEIQTADDLLSALRESNFYVFGTGFVCDLFLPILKDDVCINNLCGFITSFLNSKSSKNGIPIKVVSDESLDKDKLICIAVHESIRGEIVHVLEKYGFSRCVWIYPFLYDLRYGKPIYINRDVPVKFIYLAMRNYYSLFIRYLMIEFYYGRNTLGRNIYLKTFSSYCSRKTAEERCERFVEFIKQYDLHGYDKENPSFILDNFEILDGSHRFALSLFHESPFLTCNIYCCDKNVIEIFGEKAVVLESSLKSMFTEDEIALLKAARRRLDQRFGL